MATERSHYELTSVRTANASGNKKQHMYVDNENADRHLKHKISKTKMLKKRAQLKKTQL